MSAVRQRAVGNPVVWSMWVCAATVVLGCGDEGSGDGTLLGPPVESGSNGGGSVDAGEGAGSEDGGEMVDEGLLWIDIDLGPRVSCGIRAEGSLWCWGDVLLLGYSSDGSELEPTPHKVVDELGWRQVSAGQSHACALRDDGTVWCWGFNRCGRLGQDP
ncbi:MAG: RCC1 domain-containing protein, partial [Myxococcota bacterium]